MAGRMRATSLLILHFYASLSGCVVLPPGGAADEGPRFVSEAGNLTVAEGRSARLECTVDALGGKKMAWIHKGPVRRAVLATGAQVVTKNPRISASREGPTFVLSIDSVTELDRGVYLCQLNTQPTLTHTLVLDVVVPPVIVDGNSSRDVTADEGKDVTLTCDARGRPAPSIRWVREDGGKVLSGGTEADEWVGPELRLGPLQRGTAGAFLCIASNGVPPTVSKRVLLSVNFAPVMEEPHPPRGRRLGAPLGSDVKFTCTYAAHPPPQVTWHAPSGHVIRETPKTSVVGEQLESHRGRSSLALRGVTEDDYGRYRCEARNNRGGDSATFVLFEITTTTTTSTTTTTTLGWSLPPFRPRPTFPRTWGPPTASQPPFISWWGRTSQAPAGTTLTPGPDRSAAPSPRKHTGPFLFGRSLSSGSCWRVAPWLLLLSGHVVLLKIKFTEGLYCV